MIWGSLLACGYSFQLETFCGYLKTGIETLWMCRLIYAWSDGKLIGGQREYIGLEQIDIIEIGSSWGNGKGARLGSGEGRSKVGCGDLTKGSIENLDRSPKSNAGRGQGKLRTRVGIIDCFENEVRREKNRCFGTLGAGTETFASLFSSFVPLFCPV